MNLDPAALADDIPALSRLSDVERSVVLAYLKPAEFTPGQVLLQEGSAQLDAYFLRAGQATLRRGGRDLGVVHGGEAIGVFSLLSATSSPTTVVAYTDVHALKLSQSSFSELAEQDSKTAFALQRALIGSLTSLVSNALGSRGSLVRERSLPRQRQVTVMLSGHPEPVNVGTPLSDLLPPTIDGRLVVGAAVAGNLVSLTWPISSSGTIEPITAAHWEGQRIYRQSLALLALEAINELEPKISAYAGYTIGFAQRLNVPGYPQDALPELAQRVEARMLDLTDQQRPLREEVWTAQEAREYFEQTGWQTTARVLELSRESTVRLVSYGTQYCLGAGPILPDTGALTGFSMVSDDDGLLLVYGPRASHRPLPSRTFPVQQAVDQLGPDIVSRAFGEKESVPPKPPSTPPPARSVDRAYIAKQARQAAEHVQRMTSEQRQWLRVLGATSVGDFNHACIHGDVPQLIRVAEGFQEKRISKIAESIANHAGAVRVVCIAGPSSSGKTTFIRRLAVQLQVEGLRPVGLSLDDYYVDRDKTPRDPNGELDFESLDALRLDLLHAHLTRLLVGETVKTARYDFQEGHSQDDGGPELHIGPSDVLLLEGIHGLNPTLLSGIGSERVFRVFVCPLLQLPFDRLLRIHASDVRLLRRIVRDRHTRGATAADNILRWPSVRAGERAHIFPFQHHADAVFDSSLVYEISVLKVFAERYLLEVPERHPAYTTAFRLMQFADRFVTIYPDQVPANSILREFIGGSGFRY